MAEKDTAGRTVQKGARDLTVLIPSILAAIFIFIPEDVLSASEKATLTGEIVGAATAGLAIYRVVRGKLKK